MAESATELRPKTLLFPQDCGVTLRVAIHDAERRATQRLAALCFAQRNLNQE